MTDQQLRADGSFFTYMAPSPSWHTASTAAAIAALRVGDRERARRYGASWEQAMTFLDRLMVREDDAYWMPRPEIAIGGIRAMPRRSSNASIPRVRRCRRCLAVWMCYESRRVVSNSITKGPSAGCGCRSC
jgi:hypothetical protein